MIGFSRFEQSRANRWRPGQSGNPSGHSGAYGEAMKLAQQAAPFAVRRLIELMDSEDERVAAVACNSILDRAFGKPRAERERIDSLERRIANMTRGERLQRMKQLLLPMQQYLQEPHDGEEPEAEAAAIGSEVVETDRRRKRRPSTE
jgi:Trp operon repressor